MIFSILNLVTHLHGFSIFYQRVPKDYPYLWIVRLCPLVQYGAVFNYHMYMHWYWCRLRPILGYGQWFFTQGMCL